jgi:hypothetical protein
MLLPVVVASSATPIMAGKTILTTETNVQAAVLTEAATVVTSASNTPIVLPTQLGLMP